MAYGDARLPKALWDPAHGGKVANARPQASRGVTYGVLEFDDAMPMA